MKKMIICIPSNISPGALGILENYYHNACKDRENEYFIVLSRIESCIESTSNIKVLKEPSISNGIINRIIFEYKRLPKLVREYKPKSILYLSNHISGKYKAQQILYMHQAMPFAKLSLKDIQNIKLYIYLKIAGMAILPSIKKADRIIVQTKWLRDSCVKKSQKSIQDFSVIEPDVPDKDSIIPYSINNVSNFIIFFYPAYAYGYKNHKLIVAAVEKLVINGFNNFEVIFTINGKENKLTKKLKAITDEKNLPIKFIGKIDRLEVYKYYSKSMLLFPSLVESFGMPLLEARIANCPIIASDLPFSHEVLEEYEDVKFFNPRNAMDLYKKLSEKLKSEIYE